jgi:hypothetical protein
MLKRIAIIAGIALTVIAIGAQPTVATSNEAWAQEIADCAEATGMTDTGASAGGADITVSQNGSFITAEVFAGVGSHVTEYVNCIVEARLAPGWLHAVIGQTSDADGMEAITFGSGVTVLWSYDSDSNVMLIVATDSDITVA